MGLIERLIGTEEPKAPVHQFMSALGEWERAKWTRAQVIAAFGVQAAEEAELDNIFAKMIPPPDSISLGATVTLTNLGTTFDAIVASKGLGFARIEGAGITGVEWTVRWNKIGTGTLNWQLWDDTTAAELGLITDSAAAGDNRQQTINIVPGSPLSPGLHTIRVRARSTVSTDDPVYYGSALRIRRVDVMWSEVLHEVLLLAESAFAPYDSAAAVRTRLGI